MDADGNVTSHRRPLGRQAVQQAQRRHLPDRRDYLFHRPAPALSGGNCARFHSPACTALTRRAAYTWLRTKCEYSNGLALSPDESVLYVAISRAEPADFDREENGEFCPNRRIRAFDVAADGTLSGNRILIEMGSDAPGVPRRHEGGHPPAGSGAPGLAGFGSFRLMENAWGCWKPRRLRGTSALGATTCGRCF